MSTDELRELVASLAVAQKETDRQLQETDRQLKETDRQLKETNRDLKSHFRETDRKIRDLSTLFTGQWGKLVEALLGSGLPELFRARGIPVRATSRDIEVQDDTGQRVAQVDVMVHNGEEDIAVEVKTTCRPEDVNEHLERLRRLRELLSLYASGSKKLYGGIAALKYEAAADQYAEKKGLFVLKCTEGIVTIENRPDFRPRAF
jgi:hypothetical protein